MISYDLPLFPLNVVVCPGGLIPLKIFEARYLDMVRACLRDKTSFAIVAIMPEGETDPEGNFPFADIGTLVDIVEADVATVGLIMIRCIGQNRVKVESFMQQDDGLVIGKVTDIANDLPHPIPEDLALPGRVLNQLISNLPKKDLSAKNLPVTQPYMFDDAGWVANRWVELLDLPLLQKQRLMQIDSPIIRLELVNDILDTGYQKLS